MSPKWKKHCVNIFSQASIRHKKQNILLKSTIRYCTSYNFASTGKWQLLYIQLVDVQVTMTEFCKWIKGTSDEWWLFLKALFQLLLSDFVCSYFAAQDHLDQFIYLILKRVFQLVPFSCMLPLSFLFSYTFLISWIKSLKNQTRYL